jgi:predicted nucleic acid-binding protein
MSNQSAWQSYETFFALPQAIWLEEPPSLEVEWKRLTAGPLSTPKLWMDAYLAAFALSGGYSLVTADQAFTQFAGLKVVMV